MTTKKENCQKLAADKKQQTIEKVVLAINELLRNNQPITLELVIKKSGVSKAWFYKSSQVSIKNLIDILSILSTKKANYLLTLENRLKAVETKLKELL